MLSQVVALASWRGFATMHQTDLLATALTAVLLLEVAKGQP
jgi:hypothetical protein